MVKILALINELSATSIPFETTVQIATGERCEVTVAAFYDSVDTQACDADIPVEVHPLGAESRLDPSAWRQLHRMLQTGEYDLLHTHHNFSGSIARLIATTSNVGVVNTEHRQHSSYSILQNLVNAPTLPLADKVVFNSEATRKSLRWYERLTLNGEKQSVIYNGVNQDLLCSTVKGASDDSVGPRILSVGRLVPIKNYRTLLEAFAKIRNRTSDPTLVLVGSGPLREKLAAETTRLGIKDAVRFRGEVNRQEVYRELARADVFTMPSHAEGFCVAVVEAMAAGLPVVVSDIEVFHEVVGDVGLFANPHDSDSFTDAIAGLLQQPEKRERLGSKAKNRARSEFSLERAAREYSNLYKEVAETSK